MGFGSKADHTSGISENDWVLVDKGNLKGVTMVVDRTSGEVVSLSTSSCRDEDRWEELPDLSEYKSLGILDLDRSRYLTRFDASAFKDFDLRKLFLTRCDNLVTIAPSIGVLSNLVEVRTT